MRKFTDREKFSKNFPDEEIFPDWENNLFLDRETTPDRKILTFPNREKTFPIENGKKLKSCLRSRSFMKPA